MLSLSDNYWPYSYYSSEVYVYKRGSNVPLYHITERCCHVYTRRLHYEAGQ